MSGLEVRISNLESENTMLKHEIALLRSEFITNKETIYSKISRLSHLASDTYSMILNAREEIGDLSIEQEGLNDVFNKYNICIIGEYVSMIAVAIFLWRRS